MADANDTRSGAKDACVRQADPDEDDDLRRRYHYTEMYVLYSLATFFAFLVLVLVPRILLAPCRRKR